MRKVKFILQKILFRAKVAQCLHYICVLERIKSMAQGMYIEKQSSADDALHVELFKYNRLRSILLAIFMKTFFISTA